MVFGTFTKMAASSASRAASIYFRFFDSVGIAVFQDMALGTNIAVINRVILEM